MTNDDYGSSASTPLKVEHHRALIAYHLGVVEKVFARHHWVDPTYHYFDLTAGPGIHPETEVPQSPLRFLEETSQRMLRYRAIFIERHAETFQSLTKAIGPNPSVRVINADCREVTPGLFAAELPAPKPIYYGLVYFDPKPGKEQFEVIRMLADLFTRRQSERMDVLLYMSATSFKRLHEVSGETLRATINRFPKTHWLIRDPYDTQWQWTFLLGTNWADMKEYRKIRLFPVGGEVGSAILDRLDLTEKQRKEKVASTGQLPFPETA